MTKLKGVSDEINDKIQSECMIKKALKSARETVNYQRPITRRKIEDIKAKLEVKALESDYD